MPANTFLTGRPGVGKSTALQRAVDELEDRGWTAAGVRAPEIREDGDRVGFALVDVATGDRAVMAHRDREAGPSVGSYRVDVDAVADVAGPALERAREEADVAVVDEVAPMEVASDAFVEGTRALLDASVPTLGVIHQRSSRGFVGEVKDRPDVTVLTVTEANRDDVPDRLVDRARQAASR